MLAFSLWNAIWLVIVTVLFLGALMMLFSVITDLFSDHETSGLSKAVWAFVLVLVPLLGSLVYIAVRGDGMARRSIARQTEAKESVDDYIRDVAGVGAATELERAVALHEAGHLTDDEFATLKSKILA